MSNGTRKPMRQGQQHRRGRGRGRKPQNPLSRNLESNGPDVKIRGTASHIAEKYIALARDAHVVGDSVAGESYLQHAEHYNRIVMANQAQQQATAAAQGERMNGSGRDRQNAPAESDDPAQPEAAPAAAPGNEAGESVPAGEDTDKTASSETSDKTTTATGDAPSGKADAGKSGDDEGLARMMARSTTSSGNGADKEKPAKAAKASKAPKAAKKESSSDDAGTDDVPDEAVT